VLANSIKSNQLAKMGWREKQTKAFPLFHSLSLEMLYRRVEIEKQDFRKYSILHFFAFISVQQGKYSWVVNSVLEVHVHG